MTHDSVSVPPSDQEEIPTSEALFIARQAELSLDEHNGALAIDELVELVEALLLVAPTPPTIAELTQGAGVPVGDIETCLAILSQRLDRGWIVVRHQETVQLASAPRFAAQVRRFLGLDRESRLSPAALEALAIVAYRQPVTRGEIEAVRGVDCSGVLATLFDRGLIEATGRLETVGHPIQYGTTPAFLRHFGLQSLTRLPPLGQVDGKDAAVLLEVALIESESAPVLVDQGAAPTDGNR